MLYVIIKIISSSLNLKLLLVKAIYLLNLYYFIYLFSKFIILDYHRLDSKRESILNNYNF